MDTTHVNDSENGTTAATTPEKKAARIAFLKEAQARRKAAQPIAAKTDRATRATERALADVAHKLRQVDKAKGTKARTKAAEAVKKVARAVNANLVGLPVLPALPKSPRKPKPSRACACGCAGPTRGGRFLPGHDARLHAWATRVERGLLKAAEVPAPHTHAVAALLKAGGVPSTAKTAQTLEDAVNSAPARVKAAKRATL